jgi:hypothetical protein
MSQPTCNQGTNIKLFQAMHDAGFTLFPMYGFNKIPHKGFLDTPFEPDWTPQEGHNYGALLRRRFLVIDVDPRHYPEGRRPFRELMQALEMPVDIQKTTFTVKTPRGGYHIYFQKPETCSIVHSLKEYPGLEFKDQHIMCPGSYIFQDDKGKAINAGYTLFNGAPSAIAQADPRLLAMLKPVERKPQVLVGDITPDQVADIRWFMSFCQTTPPAVSGQNGDKTAFGVARAGRARGLSKEKVVEIMLCQYNPRCEPPDEAWLRQKIDNAFEYADEPAGVNSIQNDFEAVPVTSGVTKVSVPYQRTPAGMLKKSFANLTYFMKYPVVVSTSEGAVKEVKGVPQLFGTLKYDAFSYRLRWTKPAPWHKTSGEWDDHDAIQYMAKVSQHLAIEYQTSQMHQAAYAVASEQSFHPVREYLDSLKWDKQERVTHWLSKYCGALDNEYTRFIGRKTLVAAVARVFAPGCKFDHVLVMEGAQGIGKSYFWELMASPWFTDSPLDIDDKKAVEVMQGKWILELGEMTILSKYESSANKRFLSASSDRCRMAYATEAKDYPRQCIFVGGLNPEQNGWLRDHTGNRRYWPVPVTKIDLKAVKADRDQLWAEALEYFRKGEAIHVEDDRMRAMMEQEVEARLQEDPWFGMIEEYLSDEENWEGHLQTDGKTLHFMPVDLYNNPIGGGAAAFGSREFGRVATILKKLGFEKKRSGVSRAYYYTKEVRREV